MIISVTADRLTQRKRRIREAAKIVCADEFINEMKDGYMTEVNERGSKLSGGQKQLISFARTLLSDPKILVLDEATSSIDARTEKLLQQGSKTSCWQNFIYYRTELSIIKTAIR